MRFERYDRIVEHYPSQWPLLVPGYVPILNAMQDIVRALATRPHDILDVGCGPGSATIAVAPACHPEGTVTAVDGSEAMLEAAKRLLGSHVAAVIRGDFTEPEVQSQIFRPASADVVLCSFALHHLPDTQKRQVLEGMGQALRPGGLLLLADEIAIDRPAGLDLIERVRGRIVQEHLHAGRITKTFWELEASLPSEMQLPFMPARVDDLTSFMAHAGLASSCPVSIFGSALLIGIKRAS